MRVEHAWPYGRKGSSVICWELPAAGRFDCSQFGSWTETKTVSRQQIEEELSWARGIGGLGLNEQTRPSLFGKKTSHRDEFYGILLQAEAMRITSRYILSTGPTWSSPTRPAQGTGACPLPQ
jgi:hypothetical protein